MTDAIYILWEMQEKHLFTKKEIYFTFVDLQKALNQVRGSVLG